MAINHNDYVAILDGAHKKCHNDEIVKAIKKWLGKKQQALIQAISFETIKDGDEGCEKGNLRGIASVTAIDCNPVFKSWLNAGVYTLYQVINKDASVGRSYRQTAIDVESMAIVNEREEIDTVDLDTREKGEWIGRPALSNLLRLNLNGVEYPRFLTSGFWTLLDEETKNFFVFLELGKDEKGVQTGTVFPITGKPMMPKDFELSTQELIDEWEDMKARADHWGLFMAGPSDLRGHWGYFVKYEKGETQEAFAARMEQTLDMLTNGIFSHYKGQKMPRAKAIKKFARMALSLTGSSYLGKLHSFAYIAKEPSTEEGCLFNDGSSFIRASAFLRKLEEEHGIYLSENDAYAFALQIRSDYGPVKGLMFPKSDKWFDTLLFDNKLGVDGNPLEVVHLSFVEFDRYYDDICDDGKLYIVNETGDENGYPPEAIFDATSIKCGASYVHSNRLTINLLDIAKPAPANTNKQIISSLAPIDGFLPWLEGYAKKQVENKFRATFTVAPVVDPTGYIDSVLYAISPDATSRDKTMVESLFSSVVTSIGKMISESKYPIEGKYLRGTGDVALYFGVHVLEVDEFYAPIIKAGTKAEITRCPHMAFGEHLISKSVSLETIARRMIDAVKKGLITAKQALAIVDSYASIPKSILVLPAYKIANTATGGSDYDYDGFFAITDETWVSFAEQQPTEGIDADSVSDEATSIGQEDASYTFCYADYCKAITLQMLGADVEAGEHYSFESIGVIANRVQTLIGMLCSKEIGKLRDQYLANVILSKGKTLPGIKDPKPYARQFGQVAQDARFSDDVIGDIECKSLAEDFILSDRSIESFKNLLKDAVSAYASIGGRSIDAAKNGKQVWTYLLAEVSAINEEGEPIKRGKKLAMRTAFLTDWKLELKEDNVVASRDEELSPYVWYFDSSLETMRQNVLAWAADWLTRVYATCLKEVDDSEAKTLKKEGLCGINSNDLTFIASVLSSVQTSKLLSTKEKNMLREGIANMIRMSFEKDLSFMDKYHTLRKASLRDENTFTSLWKCLKEEAILARAQLAKEGNDDERAIYAGFHVYASEEGREFLEDGVQVELQNGRDELLNIYADSRKANGTFVIRKLNDTFYATQEFEEAFAVPEISDVALVELAPNETDNETMQEVMQAGSVRINLPSTKSHGGFGRMNGVYIGDDLNKFVATRDSKSAMMGTKAIVARGEKPNIEYSNIDGFTKLTRAMHMMELEVSFAASSVDVREASKGFGETIIRRFVFGKLHKVDRPMPYSDLRTGKKKAKKPTEEEATEALAELAAMFEKDGFKPATVAQPEAQEKPVAESKSEPQQPQEPTEDVMAELAAIVANGYKPAC